jgi:amino acid transporter
MSTWETVLSTVAFGLGNGGPGGLIWTFLAAWVGLTFVGISMAEMASMAPTSGEWPTSNILDFNIDVGSRRPVPLGV